MPLLGATVSQPLLRRGTTWNMTGKVTCGQEFVCKEVSGAGVSSQSRSVDREEGRATAAAGAWDQASRRPESVGGQDRERRVAMEERGLTGR
jgi:hypothetical protein